MSRTRRVGLALILPTMQVLRSIPPRRRCSVLGKLLEFSNSPGKAGKVVKRTLSCGNYEADFYTDPKTTLVNVIITKRGDAEILMWGQEPSMAEAERFALDWMSSLSSRLMVG